MRGLTKCKEKRKENSGMDPMELHVKILGKVDTRWEENPKNLGVFHLRYDHESHYLSQITG